MGMHVAWHWKTGRIYVCTQIHAESIDIMHYKIYTFSFVQDWPCKRKGKVVWG